jgi:type I restriction enzyme S subunit
MNEAAAIAAPALSADSLDFLPENWARSRLGDLFEIQQGKALNAKRQSDGTRRPFLRTANVLWGRLDLGEVDGMAFSPEEEQRLALKTGDLLTCEGGDVGRTAIWRGELEPCFYQNHLHRLRSLREDVEPEFFMRWMEAAIRLLGLYGGTSNKTTIPNLSKNRLAAFVVPHPSHLEQRAIAAALRLVQVATEATEHVIAATRALKRGLVEHLYSFGSVAVSEGSAVQTVDSEIGSIPSSWRILPLEDVVEVCDQARVPLRESDRRGRPGPYPYCGANGVIDHIDSYRYEGEYVLLAEDGGYWGPGESSAYLMNGRFWVNNHAHVLRAKASVADARFLVHALNRADIARFISGTTRGKLTQGVMRKLLIPTPQLEEQRVIAGHLQVIDSKLAAEQSRLASLRALMESLLRDLLTGARRLPAFMNGA